MSKLKRGLIVSCQAGHGEVFNGLDLMKYFAKAAINGGAIAIRSLVEDIQSIKDYNDNITIIGLEKKCYPDSEVYITPTYKEVDHLLSSACEIIALDATFRERPNHITLKELVAYIRQQKDVELMADISTIEEAIEAEKLGFDYISTTLRGHTKETKHIETPDFAFIKDITKVITKSKVIIEGGIWEANQASVISQLNPYAIVIGTSITRPSEITKRFVEHIQLEAKV